MTLKLSEAIREGAKLRPQCRGGYFMSLPNVGGPNMVQSCALGAAWEGAMGTATDVSPRQLFDRFPELFSYVQPLIDEIENPTQLHRVISLLNDEYCWTREQIADWVESLGY